MPTLLIVAAVIEVLTGLVLIAAPTVLVPWLFVGDLSASGLALARLAGIALLALGVACWPVRQAPGSVGPALRAILLYNFLVALYFAYRGIRGEIVGPLLWPAAGLHAVLALLLGWAWQRARAEAGRNRSRLATRCN